MAPVRRAFDGRIIIVAALAAGSVCGFGEPARAAPAWLRNAWKAAHHEDGRLTTAPPVARYVIDEGGAFVIDNRDVRHPMLKFEDSPEVWVMSTSRGPRGDVLYKNDLGEPMLRATRLGGMTVFTDKRPGGSAAALAAGLCLRHGLKRALSGGSGRVRGAARRSARR